MTLESLGPSYLGSQGCKCPVRVQAPLGAVVAPLAWRGLDSRQCAGTVQVQRSPVPTRTEYGVRRSEAKLAESSVGAVGVQDCPPALVNC